MLLPGSNKCFVSLGWKDKVIDLITARSFWTLYFIFFSVSKPMIPPLVLPQDVPYYFQPLLLPSMFLLTSGVYKMVFCLEKHRTASLSTRRKAVRKCVPNKISSSPPSEPMGWGGWLKSMDYTWAPWDFSELFWDRKWWSQLSHELGGGFLSQLGTQRGWGRECREEVGHGEVPTLPLTHFSSLFWGYDC